MFTLTRKDFSDIHNGLCYLRFAMQDLEEVLSPALMQKITKAANSIEKGFAGVREQEVAEFDRKSEHYKAVANEHNITTAVWSIFDVESLYTKAEGFDDAVALNYMGQRVFMGSGPKTWVDLFKAADIAIRDSEDYHVFVEGFHKTKEPGVITMTTGS